MKPKFVTVFMSVIIHEENDGDPEEDASATHEFTMPIEAAGSTNLNMVANALHQLAFQDGVEKGLIVLPDTSGAIAPTN
jgi:hypothetical protein